MILMTEAICFSASASIISAMQGAADGRIDSSENRLTPVIPEEHPSTLLTRARPPFHFLFGDVSGHTDEREGVWLCLFQLKSWIIATRDPQLHS